MSRDKQKITEKYWFLSKHNNCSLPAGYAKPY